MRWGRRTRRRPPRPNNHEDDASSSADRLRRSGGMPPWTAHTARRRGSRPGARPAAAGVVRPKGLQERPVLLPAARLRFRHHLLQGRHRQLPGDRARPRRPAAIGGLLPRDRVRGRAEGDVRDLAQVLPADRGARRVLPGRLDHCDALLTSVQALFGGSFDPVHVGHLVAAETVGEALGATIRFLPAREQPLKRAARAAHGASPEQRAEMLQLAVAGNPRLAVERIELTLPTPSYTVRTLRALAQP